jgi:ABC-type Fe3+-hydroxamate transport system substrate-binding protein
MLMINPSLQRTPQRIVCLVPRLTEALFAFGLGGAIVGITDYCVEPQPQVRKKATIGGTKNPDVEAILRLAPALMVANVEENRREDVERLQGHGVPVFICFPCTVIEAIASLWTLAQITGAEFAGFPSIPAVRDGRIHVIDGKPVCWYWSRLDESLRVLSGLLISQNSSPPGLPAGIHPLRG